MIAERRQLVQSEDDDDDDSVETKQTKKSTRTASKQKGAATADQRSRPKADYEAASVTQRDNGRSSGGKSGRSSLTKENHCIDEDKQVLRLCVFTTNSGCPQLLEIWNFIHAPGKFNCQLKYHNMPITEPNLVTSLNLRNSFDHV